MGDSDKLSLSKSTQCQMTGWQMNGEMERDRKELLVVQWRYSPGPRTTSPQDTECPHHNFKQVHVLNVTTMPTCSVWCMCYNSINSLWNFNRQFTIVYKYVYRPHLLDHKVHTKPTWTQPSQMYSAQSTHQLVASAFSTWQLVHFKSLVLDSFCTLSASQPASRRNWFSIMFFERQWTRHTVHMTTLFSETLD